MGLIYFLSFFTLIPAVVLVWAVIQLWKTADNNTNGALPVA